MLKAARWLLQCFYRLNNFKVRLCSELSCKEQDYFKRIDVTVVLAIKRAIEICESGVVYDFEETAAIIISALS